MERNKKPSKLVQLMKSDTIKSRENEMNRLVKSTKVGRLTESDNCQNYKNAMKRKLNQSNSVN